MREGILSWTVYWPGIGLLLSARRLPENQQWLLHRAKLSQVIWLHTVTIISSTVKSVTDVVLINFKKYAHLLS